MADWVSTFLTRPVRADSVQVVEKAWRGTLNRCLVGLRAVQDYYNIRRSPIFEAKRQLNRNNRSVDRFKNDKSGKMPR
jgi:hypothetical protein